MNRRSVAALMSETEKSTNAVQESLDRRDLLSKLVDARYDLAIFDVQVDFLGNGSWVPYEGMPVRSGYRYHVFPAGFSAHWVRLTADVDCTASAEFIYT